MDYVEHFYSQVHGCYPFENDDNRLRSQKIIDYLQDAGISPDKILRFVEEAPASDCLNPNILPDWLWDGSLLSQRKYYYHSLLHITSKPPTFNPYTGIETVAPFYMEMAIEFTVEDLIKYFYDNLGVSYELMDVKRDSGAFNYMLDKCKRYKFVEPIDFVLTMIDLAKSHSDERRITSVLDLNAYEAEAYELLERRAQEANLYKANKIVWR